MQAVATEHVGITQACFPNARIYLHIVAATDRARDHVALFADAGLVGCDQALLELPSDKCVIFRELQRVPRAHSVDTTIADLAEHDAIAKAHHRADGRAHPGFASVEFRHREQDVGRGLHRTFEQAARGAGFLFGLRPSERERALATLDHAVNGVDGFTARDLAGSVPAHAVGDHPQPEFVVTEVSVLVHRAATSD